MTTPAPAVALALLSLAVVWSASCGGAPQPSAPAPVQASAPRAALADTAGLDPAWLDEAAIVLVARYEEGTWPHTVEPDGSHIYYMRRTFVVEEVLRGGARLAHDRFDFELPSEPSLRFPPELRQGRRHLVLLAPGAAAAARLADPDATFGFDEHLRRADLVAIVDLDASDDERAEHRAAVEQWRQREAVELDPAGWTRLRAKPALEPEALMGALHAVREHHLPGWQTRDDALALLGPPDTAHPDTTRTLDTYHLGRTADPRDGQWSATLELTYDAAGRLLEYGEDFERASAGQWRQADYDVKRAAGLSWHRIERPAP